MAHRDVADAPLNAVRADRVNPAVPFYVRGSVAPWPKVESLGTPRRSLSLCTAPPSEIQRKQICSSESQYLIRGHLWKLFHEGFGRLS